MTTGHGSDSNRMAAEILQLRQPDKRCKTCRNWQAVHGGQEVANVCFLDGTETNSDYLCDAWILRKRYNWNGWK